MNLLFFTPAIRSSAIGRMCSIVARELAAQGHSVTVVRTESESLLGSETHDFGAAVVPWTESARIMAAAQNADVFIYQIGDCWQFHQGGLHWLALLPGLVCLHDYFLGSLFCAWAQACRPQADNVLRAWYGDAIACRYFSFPDTWTFIEGTMGSAPMTEWVCSMALGVITHSTWGIARVLDSCPGPVRVVPLAYNAPDALLGADQPQARCPGMFQILTIGHVNPNKRVASVIRAIGNSPLLRQCTIYRLVGSIQPATVLELSAEARSHGVNLVISGEVDDTALAHFIGESDVVSCLRWPPLEAGSASVIEAMLYAKPVIVTNAGCYQEIPDSCAMKVRPENELGDLQSALEFLAKDQDQRQAVGARGQQWAKKTFTAENYARELIGTVEAVMKARPALNAVTYFCSVMQRWSAIPAMLNNEEVIGPLRIFDERGDGNRLAR